MVMDIGPLASPFLLRATSECWSSAPNKRLDRLTPALSTPHKRQVGRGADRASRADAVHDNDPVPI